MGKRKTHKQCPEDSSDMEGNSLNSDERKKIEKFNSDESWQELDSLEANLFNGIVENPSPEEAYNQGNVKLKQKNPNLRAIKIDQVKQYSTELEKIKADSTAKFYFPIDKPNLRISEDELLKKTKAVLRSENFVHQLGKKIGLKNTQNIAKVRILEELHYCQQYLVGGVLPEYYLRQFQKLMGEEEVEMESDQDRG